MLFNKEEIKQLKSDAEKQQGEIGELKAHSKAWLELKEIFTEIMEAVFLAHGLRYTYPSRIELGDYKIEQDCGTYYLSRKTKKTFLLVIRESFVFKYKDEDLPEIITVMQSLQAYGRQKIEDNKDIVETERYKKDKETVFYKSLCEMF